MEGGIELELSDVEFVLTQLKISDLRTLAERLGLEVSSRRKEDYIRALAELDWSEDLEILESFVLEAIQRDVKSVDITVYALPDDSSLRAMARALSENTIEDIGVLFSEERDHGFQVEGTGDGALRGAFYYASDKLVFDILRGTAEKSRRVEYVPFEVDGSNNRVKVLTNRPSHCQKLQKMFQETTGLELTVNGLYQYAGDSMERVRAFLNGLVIQDAVEIALWFPETLRERVFRITYDGHDIFSDRVILQHINREDAVVTGFTVLIQYDGYVFKVKVGSNKTMGYVSVKLGSGLLEPGRRLAEMLYRRYLNHLE